MKSLKFWIPVAVSFLVTPIFLYLGIASGGAGHGHYLLAKILFPFTMLSTRAFGSIVAPFIVLAIVQFPIYGFILGKANLKGRMFLCSIGVLLIHLLAATACFLIVDENFS